MCTCQITYTLFQVEIFDCWAKCLQGCKYCLQINFRAYRYLDCAGWAAWNQLMIVLKHWTKPKRNLVHLLSTTKVFRVFEIRCDLTWTRLPGCRPSAAVWCCSPAQRWKVEHRSPSSRAWQTDWGSWTEKCCPLPPGRLEQKTEFNWWSDTGALSASQPVGLSIPWFLCHWDGSSSTCYIPPEQSIGDATPHIHWSTQTSSGSKSKSEFFNIQEKCLFWSLEAC